MISFLQGSVKQKNFDSVTLLVGGVGYHVFLPSSILSRLSLGEPLDLHIHTHVREDALDLFGFPNTEGLNLFKMLLSVSGIGPRTALLVLDKGVDPVKQAIIKADETFFTLVPRLGKKNAQKIIIELKSKLGSLSDLDLTGGSATSELLDALESMGYSPSEARQATKNLPPETIAIEDQIRFALKSLSKLK
ncbi:MAG: Holliday junction ATP-dependent DNA helicase RuvA [Microgenomates group bacterium GW2011_GWA1_48_10]|uniref:Holliday junction branch migration complex subunit RuvA n=1 Tax=Candidatus Gottesmanbacteria bacterium RIFCSPHIGHO2_01_FULL_47_48 TaxID=1798381 RepID=A0A1F6A3W9_9BACT|nr:MAG: Holliday junction ATP-dependent DNA helicase RuvA [Microgenomates group bacterium GW2011_GWA1_48_10]OGG19395.1 MAG: Holliday junction DNA helicase RuvA [Candidatus Gottesmanbacteria bacterium RIFCSPHIGHO2_01_FULL_47_48]